MVDQFISVVVVLFFIINPIGLIPVFVALTADTPDTFKRRMAIKGVFIGTIILLMFAIIGESILSSLGISLPVFRTGGGVILLITALNMVFEKRHQRNIKAAEDNQPEIDLDEESLEDVSVFPIATLFLSGPGAITTTMLLMETHGSQMGGQFLVLGSITLVMLITLVALLLANELAKFLPEVITVVISRILGLLLVALAVQFIFDGIKQTFF